MKAMKNDNNLLHHHHHQLAKTVAAIIKTTLCKETGMYTNANLPTPCPSLVTSGAKGAELQEPAKDTTRKAVPQLLHQVATNCRRSETILGGIKIGKLPKLLPFGRFWHTIFANKGGLPKKKLQPKRMRTGLATHRSSSATWKVAESIYIICISGVLG